MAKLFGYPFVNKFVNFVYFGLTSKLYYCKIKKIFLK